MSGSSAEDIGDEDGLQIKPPQQLHRRRNRQDRADRRWAWEQERQGRIIEGGSNRGTAGESRRREYYDQRGERGHPRSQRNPELGEGSRERRAVDQDRHRKRRYEDYGQGSGIPRRGNPNDPSTHRGQVEVRRTEQGQHRDPRDAEDNRSKQHKSVKQKRKHLELEEQRALRDIEKRNRREQKGEQARSSTIEKRRKKHEASPAHSSPENSPIENSDQEDDEGGQPSQNVSHNTEELDDILIVEEIVKSSPEFEDEDEPKQYEERPYHSDVSSGDEADQGSQNEEKVSHSQSSPKSGQSDSSSSKTGSDSDGSSDSKSSGEDSDPEQDRNPGTKNGTKTSGGVEEKIDAKGSSDVEVLDVEQADKNKVQMDESLLTEVDRAIREVNLLPAYFPALQGCRRVEEFSLLNRIEEGTYGVVYRARDRRTNEVVALKRLKMEKEKDGFPITSLREINTLLKAQHENIVTVREIVVGSNTDKIFLVMDYVEHDLKALMETLKQKTQMFLLQEVKCLMIQLLRAVAHLHDNWILHRDLKTSNLLLSHKGILKVGDFGLAREYGSPLKAYTPIVVTLWYRAPELLLGIKDYSTPIDVWSVGCIFGELVKMEPTFPGKSEANQLNLIFQTLGTPNDRIWPGYSKLPLLQKMTFVEQPMNKLKTRFGSQIGDKGIDLMNKLLTYNPAKRITAEEALTHPFFKESPLPIDPSVFPTWPAKSELGHRKAPASPKPPSGGRQFKDLRDDDDSSGFFLGNVAADRRLPMGGGFSLKF